MMYITKELKKALVQTELDLDVTYTTYERLDGTKSRTRHNSYNDALQFVKMLGAGPKSFWKTSDGIYIKENV